MLRFFYAPHTCSLASHIAMEEAGAKVKLVRIDFARDQQRDPAFVAVNPKGRVPALFAAVEYDLGPQFTVSLESRYQKDKSTIAGATTSFDAESKDTLPRAIVQFKPN